MSGICLLMTVFVCFSSKITNVCSIGRRGMTLHSNPSKVGTMLLCILMRMYTGECLSVTVISLLSISCSFSFSVIATILFVMSDLPLLCPSTLLFLQPKTYSLCQICCPLANALCSTCLFVNPWLTQKG